MIEGKNIILGISGGIAAYKIPLLVRLLKKEGANVRVIMTPMAREFVSAKTLSVLSDNPVYTDFFNENYLWNNHVKFAEWGDLMVVAPATANILAKMSTGICDNLLLSVYYSARCPVMLFPAMDLEMYAHPTLKQNLRKLEENGNIIIPAESGPLASGLFGEGRMPEPEAIFNIIKGHFATFGPLKGKKVLINAGPTFEKIDPVRFLGNRSSGKMGISIAEAFAERGAQVILVLGPVCEIPKSKNIRLIKVESAREMLDAMMQYYLESDFIVCSAAVADFRPKEFSTEKIKKNNAGNLNLELTLNPDILLELGRRKKENQVLVGFALETENEMEYGIKKLKEKNADYMVINKENQQGQSVFGSETNSVTIINRQEKSIKFEKMTKKELGVKIVEIITGQEK
jgi:phosphopantothenoylcysteine decarboxylase/phosphopantothenate--cysteine ligase